MCAHKFNYNRTALLAGLGESARKVVSTFDRSAEAKHLSEQITSSLLQTVAMQLGAVTIVCILSYYWIFVEVRIFFVSHIKKISREISSFFESNLKSCLVDRNLNEI